MADTHHLQGTVFPRNVSFLECTAVYCANEGAERYRSPWDGPTRSALIHFTTGDFL